MTILEGKEPIHMFLQLNSLTSLSASAYMNLYYETESYIYFARIWKSGGVCTHILKGHSDAVTSICYVKPKGKVTI